MESEHRKIELQSPADLAFLASQIRTAARHKLDLHLPPVSDSPEPDELRKHVEDLVDAFVAQVLAGMRHNISINGLDVVARGRDGDEPMAGVESVGAADAAAVENEDFAPFDDKLRARLGAAVQKRDGLVAKISQHRRSTPAAAAAAWQTQFAREEEALFAVQAEVADAVQVAGHAQVATVQGMERAEHVVRNWQRAVEGLARLNKGLPETRARLERCGDVVGYLGGDGEGMKMKK